MKPNLDIQRLLRAQAQAAFRIFQKRDEANSGTPREEEDQAEPKRVYGMSTPQRRRNYLRQPGGKRIHILGSEGGLTGPQQRRLKHKMGHRKRAAVRRRRP